MVTTQWCTRQNQGGTTSTTSCHATSDAPLSSLLRRRILCHDGTCPRDWEEATGDDRPRAREDKLSDAQDGESKHTTHRREERRRPNPYHARLRARKIRQRREGGQRAKIKQRNEPSENDNRGVQTKLWKGTASIKINRRGQPPDHEELAKHDTDSCKTDGQCTTKGGQNLQLKSTPSIMIAGVGQQHAIETNYTPPNKHPEGGEPYTNVLVALRKSEVAVVDADESEWGKEDGDLDRREEDEIEKLLQEAVRAALERGETHDPHEKPMQAAFTQPHTMETITTTESEGVHREEDEHDDSGDPTTVSVMSEDIRHTSVEEWLDDLDVLATMGIYTTKTQDQQESGWCTGINECTVHDTTVQHKPVEPTGSRPCSTAQINEQSTRALPTYTPTIQRQMIQHWKKRKRSCHTQHRADNHNKPKLRRSMEARPECAQVHPRHDKWHVIPWSQQWVYAALAAQLLAFIDSLLRRKGL